MASWTGQRKIFNTLFIFYLLIYTPILLGVFSRIFHVYDGGHPSVGGGDGGGEVTEPARRLAV